MAVFTRAGVRFFAHPADRLAGDRRRKASLHDCVSQEPQGSVGLPCGGRGTRHREQVRCLLPRQFPLGAWPRCLGGCVPPWQSPHPTRPQWRPHSARLQL